MVRNLSLIASHLNNERFQACFIALQGERDRGYELPVPSRQGITFESIHDRAKVDFAVLKQLRERLAADEFDVVSAHGHKADMYAALLRIYPKARRPTLAIAHGWVVSSWKYTCYDFVDKCCLWFFDRVVLVSGAQRRAVPHIPGKKLRVIYNAIDSRETPPSQARVVHRQTLGIADETFAFGFCGRLSEEKGIRTAIEALALLNDETFHYFICGEGAQQTQLERLSASLGVASQVHFLGFTQSVEPVLQALDLYVSCSKKEGLPNNVLEAQSLGLPCVLSDIGPHQEISGQGSSAELVPVGNASALAEALRQLRADSERRQYLANAGARRVREVFSMQKRIAALEEEYSRLASR